MARPARSVEAAPGLADADRPGRGAMVDPISIGGIVPAPTIPGSYISPSSIQHPPTLTRPDVMPLAGTPAPGSVMDTGAARFGGDPAMPASVSGSVPGLEPGPAAAPRWAAAPASGGPGRPLAGNVGEASPTGVRGVLSDLAHDGPNALAGWLVAAGSGVGALSFLLPWAPGIVDYTSSWGLASRANLPILAVLIATAVLATLSNPVPQWARTGVLGLMAGSLFLGLLWPFVVGDFGAEFGSIIGAAAAIVLIVGGALAVAPSRTSPPVS